MHMSATNEPNRSARKAAVGFAGTGLVVAPLCLVMLLIGLRNGGASVMFTGWLAIGSTAALWLLLERLRVRGRGRVLLMIANFVVAAILGLLIVSLM